MLLNRARGEFVCGFNSGCICVNHWVFIESIFRKDMASVFAGHGVIYCVFVKSKVFTECSCQMYCPENWKMFTECSCDRMSSVCHR